MITKERLEELIKQGATIYWIYGKSIEKKTLKHKYNSFFICDNELNEYNAKQYIGIWKHKLSKLFETKEEAEWHKEFGCIERTERLELPTWEEFISGTDCTFIIDAIRYRLYIDIDPVEKVEDKIFIEKIYTRQDIYGTRIDWDFLFHKPVTKENYTLACRKAKELFLGEKK